LSPNKQKGLNWLHFYTTTYKNSFCIKANTMSKLLLMSNLRLGGKVLAVAAGDAEENGSSSVPSAWAALRAAHADVGQKPMSSILVSLFYQARTYFQSRSD
jgi:hypothetical protein